MAKFATNTSGAIWWPNFQLIQVAPSGGQICKWCHVVAKFNPSHGVNFWVRCASGNVLMSTLPPDAYLGAFVISQVSYLVTDSAFHILLLFYRLLLMQSCCQLWSIFVVEIVFMSDLMMCPKIEIISFKV